MFDADYRIEDTSDGYAVIRPNGDRAIFDERIMAEEAFLALAEHGEPEEQCYDWETMI